MKMDNIKDILVLISIIILIINPVYASSLTYQTVSVTIPESNGISTNYINRDNSIVETMLMHTIKSLGQVKLVNPSNADTEIWIRASNGNKEESSNIKYYIDGTDIKGEFNDSYTKAVTLNKSKQGSPLSELNLNSYINMPYVDKSTIIYVTSIKCDTTGI
ncbi:hypothetical protein [Methanobacterium sp.]|uniref:hypothetical protein n=1 Tax=Methanobacterium sp. TaxID=2164 RepID=UPI003C735BDF